MDRRFRIFAVAATAVLVGSAALAADTPKFEKLDREQVKKGASANVRAIGSGFGDSKDGVEVTAGGSVCNITMVEPTAISFQLPNTLPLGSATVSIKVKGQTFTAKVQVVAKLTDAAHTALEKGGDSATVPDPSGMIKATLTLTPGAKATATVECTSQIPQDLMVEIQLVLAGLNGEQDCVIDTHKTKITKGGLIKTVFEFEPGKTFCVGKYFCMVDFYLDRQSGVDLKSAKWENLDAQAKRRYGHLWSRDDKDFGTPEQAKKENELLRAHYLDLTKALQTQLDAVERGYGAAGKAYAKKPSGGIDDDEYKKWLNDRGLGTTEDDLKKLKADNRFMRGVYFNPDAWQAWVEKDVFKALLDQRKAQDEMHNKFIGVKNPKLDLAGYELISIVGKLVQIYSTEIYSWSKLAVPDSIRNPKDLFTGHEVPQASKNEFETHKRILLERLDQYAPAAAPAKPEKK